MAGVAGALADVIGVSTLAARLAFVVLSFAGGVGLAAYVVLWLLLPAEGSQEPIVRRAVADRRTVSLVLAGASAIAAVMIAAGVLGAGVLLGTVAPGAVSLAGLVAVWRHAGPDDKAAALRLAAQLSGTNPGRAPSRRRLVSGGLRLLAGVVLVGVGTSAFFGRQHLSGADFRALLATLAVLAGFGLVFAPWWLRLGKDLASERRERARAQERAEMASHLHDSVLQTLALIQRTADDPHQVKRLARAQERQLRAWLFEGAPGHSRRRRSWERLGSACCGTARRGSRPQGERGGRDGGRRPLGRAPRGSPWRQPVKLLSTQPNGQEPISCLYMQKWNPKLCRSSYATGVGVLTGPAWPPTARASASPYAPGWTAMAVPQRCGAHLGRALK